MDYRKLVQTMDEIKEYFLLFEDFINGFEDAKDLLNKLTIIYLKRFGEEFTDPTNVLAFKQVIEEDHGLVFEEAEELFDLIIEIYEIVTSEEESEEEGHQEGLSSGDSGYIYILMNPSMEGIVKIGKTTRDPETRMNELSSATGVPTPFVLVYKEYFDDCSNAESVIHELLETKQYRVSTNREFFKVPVYEAITLVQDVKASGSYKTRNAKSEANTYQNDEKTLADQIFDQAENYYYGFDDTLENPQKALELYKKAAKLGSAQAFSKLGNIYYFDDYIVKEDVHKALDYYQQAASLGLSSGYADMAMIYSSKYSDVYNIRNAKKCWDFFCKMEVNNPPHQVSVYLLGDYINFCLGNNLPIDYEELIREYRLDILSNLEEKFAHDYTKAKDYLRRLTPGKIENMPLQIRVRSEVYEGDNNPGIFVDVLSGRLRKGDILESENNRIIVESIFFDNEFRSLCESVEDIIISFTGNCNDLKPDDVLTGKQRDF